ncbi:MAG: glycosyltransferase family 2 protein [Bacteroidales bacterium]|jgi:glycosyltransferase involved in cell wall biosynthesis
MENNVSFIVPAYNCSQTIAEAIESIYKGNIISGDEIIIIDDASTDNTKEIILDLQNKHKEIKLLKHNYNKGTAAAGRNTGIDNSINNLIFCLDSDNVLAPDSIPKLKDFLLSSKIDAAAFGEIHYFINNIENVTNKWILNEEITFIDTINEGEKAPCSSGNYMFTKESWIKAGKYFEPTLINQTIDSWAFGLRQLATGSKMLTLKNSFYLHRHGYNSHFVLNYDKGNLSLAFTSVLIPFLHLIDDRDVNYIFSKKHRYNWFKNIKNRPIKLKTSNDFFLKKIIKKILKHIKHKIA